MRSRTWLLLGAALLPGLGRPASSQETEPAGGFKVLLETQSLYHYLRVVEEGGVRRLQFRRSGTDYEESAICVADPLRLEMSYYRAMLASLVHDPDPRAVLFVGLGGGTLPIVISRYFPQARIDAVELDPEVHRVAREYFGFEEGPRMKLYLRDARVQVRKLIRQGAKYDLIMLDAFRGGYIPYHLTTKEFLEQVKALLSPEGIVVSNLRPGFESYHYHRRTLAAVFRNEWSYGGQVNRIVVVDDRDDPPSREELLARADRLEKEKKLRADIVSIVAQGGRGGEYVKEGPILTDDFAPTDVLRSIPRD